jgi:hypothetical protein
MSNPKKKKNTYRSPETRARQLAGLGGVKVEKHVQLEEGATVEKVNGKGMLAMVPEETRKLVIDLYCQGNNQKAISQRTGLSETAVRMIRDHTIDHDSQFRDKMHAESLKQKIQKVASGAADRVTELMSEMSAKDSVLALGIATDKLLALERNKSPESLHQHVHVHTTAEVGDAFMQAMKPK